MLGGSPQKTVLTAGASSYRHFTAVGGGVTEDVTAGVAACLVVTPRDAYGNSRDDAAGSELNLLAVVVTSVLDGSAMTSVVGPDRHFPPRHLPLVYPSSVGINFILQRGTHCLPGPTPWCRTRSPLAQRSAQLSAHALHEASAPRRQSTRRSSRLSRLAGWLRRLQWEARTSLDRRSTRSARRGLLLTLQEVEWMDRVGTRN